MNEDEISKARWAFDEKQHDQIRADIQGLETYGRTFDSVAIVAIAALWTWALKDGGLDLRTTGVISALIAFLSGLKAIAVWRLILAKRKYIMLVEKTHSALGGYEGSFQIPSSSFIVPATIFLILVIVSLCEGFYGASRKFTSPTPTPITITCVPPLSNATPDDRSAPRGKRP